VISLLTGGPYTPPWLDQEVVDGITGAFGDTDEVTVSSGWELQGGNGPDLSIQVALPPGLTQGQLHDRQTAWAEHWGANQAVNQRVDGLQPVSFSPGP
jgi:hypothetical protein